MSGEKTSTRRLVRQMGIDFGGVCGTFGKSFFLFILILMSKWLERRKAWSYNKTSLFSLCIVLAKVTLFISYSSNQREIECNIYTTCVGWSLLWIIRGLSKPCDIQNRQYYKWDELYSFFDSSPLHYFLKLLFSCIKKEDMVILYFILKWNEVRKYCILKRILKWEMIIVKKCLN